MNPQLRSEMGIPAFQYLSALSDQEIDLKTPALIAGGSVSAYLRNTLKKMKDPFNDIDLFVQAKDQPKNEVGMATTTLSVSESIEEVDLYGNLQIVRSQIYKLKNSERFGNLNVVHCQTIKDNFASTQEMALSALRTFDINQCQVGIYHHPGQEPRLIWTPEYQKFWDTSQLDVSCVNTPIHTAVRILDKHAQLEGTFLNRDAVMQLLAARADEINQVIERISENNYCSNRRMMHVHALTEKLSKWQLKSRLAFGGELKNKLIKVQSQIAPYFEIPEDINESKRRVFSIKPRTSEIKRYYAEMGESGGISLLNEKKMLAFHRADTFSYKANICKQIKHCLKTNDIEASMISVQGSSYFEKEVSLKELGIMSNLLKEHRGLWPFFANQTIDKRIKIAKAIRKTEKIFGIASIGILETMQEYNYSERMEIVSADTQSDIEKILSNFIKPKLADMAGNLCESKFPPSLVIGGYAIKNLITKVDLLTEGTEQCHCVGGYASFIKDRVSIILSLRKEEKNGRKISNESLTMEIRTICRDGKTKYVLNQFKGKQNRFPDANEYIVAKTVLAYVVMQERNMNTILKAPLLLLSKSLTLQKVFSKLSEYKITKSKILKIKNILKIKLQKPNASLNYDYDDELLPF